MDITTLLPTLSSSTDFSIILDAFQDSYQWILITGFVVALFLAFGVGANDVANTFGTSVGSGVISLRNACIVATIFELLGAILIGYKVSDTIRKGIVDPEVYAANPEEFMLGNLSALGASAIWLILATFLKMPISGTHSIVGAVLGYTLVARGNSGIQWWKVGSIVASWFVSPVLSGIVSGLIYFGIRRFILNKEDAITPGLRSLPVFYGLTVFINLISIFMDGPDMFKIQSDSLPDWTEPVFGLLISISIGLVVATGVGIWIVPRLRKQITGLSQEDAAIKSMGSPSTDKKKLSYTNGILSPKDVQYGIIEGENEKKSKSPSLEVVPMDGVTPNSSGAPLIKTPVSHVEAGFHKGSDDGDQDDGIIFPSGKTEEAGDRPGVGRLFSFLQILTAAFGSFAHGGNDVSNAIGPLIALWLVYKEGEVHTKSTTPIWLLVYGGAGISLGLWVWGRRVIKTMGEDLTKITPSSGFTIEIGAAITVLVASKIGIPVSTTHCKVGSVVLVGWLKSAKEGVDWSLFRNIVFAWVVTVPVSAGLSALLMWMLTSWAI